MPRNNKDEEQGESFSNHTEIDENQTVGLLGNDNEEAKKSSKETTKTLPLLIIAWYASSIICTNTSKSLKLPGSRLTLYQMIISTVCAYIGISIFELDGVGRPKVWPAKNALTSTIVLSWIFCIGFVTLNASLRLMHISSVMTVRAAEPVSTWLLGLVLLPNEKTSIKAVFCLIPIVFGAGLSAIAPDSNMNTAGFSVVVLCNICFSLRTILTKHLQSWSKDIDHYNLFLQLCLLGSIWQGIVVLIASKPATHNQIPSIPSLLFNGFTFYLYLQLSWVVMGKVGAVTHSVCNSLRFSVICAGSWFVFGGITWVGVAGTVIATLGTILYAKEKRKGKESHS